VCSNCRKSLYDKGDNSSPVETVERGVQEKFVIGLRQKHLYGPTNLNKRKGRS
jgi:hypothetical protein